MVRLIAGAKIAVPGKAGGAGFDGNDKENDNLAAIEFKILPRNNSITAKLSFI